jgi:hypothetical protein
MVYRQTRRTTRVRAEQRDRPAFQRETVETDRTLQKIVVKRSERHLVGVFLALLTAQSTRS